jgi:hypothetical protein
MRTSHELFKPYGVKDNYGIPQRPTLQLSLKQKQKEMYGEKTKGIASPEAKGNQLLGVKTQKESSDAFFSSEGSDVCDGPYHHIKRKVSSLLNRECTSRESNPGLYRGRVLFYH